MNLFRLFVLCYCSTSYNLGKYTEEEYLYEINKSFDKKSKIARTLEEKEDIRHARWLIADYKNCKTILNTIMRVLFGGALCMILDRIYEKDVLFSVGYVFLVLGVLMSLVFLYGRTKKSKYNF